MPGIVPLLEAMTVQVRVHLSGVKVRYTPYRPSTYLHTLQLLSRFEAHLES